MKRLTFKAVDKRGIPLAEVIAVHKQFSRGRKVLRGNLGDGYLYAFNPVFRTVRDEFLRLGFRFALAKHFPNYYSFPLMSLDDAISARAVPYFENFYWLERLQKDAPGKFTLAELKRSELQFNYLFHESAHFIAHAKIFGKKKIPKTEEGLLGVLLGEAFANATECLSAAFAEGEIGGYLLNANCHFRANKEEVKELLRCGKGLGFEATARVLIASFLYSNYLYESLNASQMNKIREFSGVGKVPIRRLVKIGLQLNVQFRTTTTHLHLMKVGFPSHLTPWMRKDPGAMLLKNSKLHLAAMELAKILAR